MGSAHEWRKEEPPRAAPAIPEEVAFAAFTLLWSANKKPEAVAILICFCGLLRIGEALALNTADVVFQGKPGKACVLLLHKTKTAAAEVERVALMHPVVVAILQAYATTAGDGQFLPTTYRRVASCLGAATGSFGFDLHFFRTHSLRRGGATTLMMRGFPMLDIMHFGRWASEKSCRLYLKTGSIIILRAREGKYKWARIRALAYLASSIAGD